MKRMITYSTVTAVLLLAGVCNAGNFMVYKEGKSFYLTADSSKLRQVLCDSGDINSVLKDSELPVLLQKELKDGICASRKVKKTVLRTLNGMSKEQDSALRDAFIRNGYEINKVADACGGG